MNYAHLLEFVYSNPWAIKIEKLYSIYGVIARKAEGFEISKDEIQAIAEAGKGRTKRKRSSGDVAVLPVMGIISHRAGMVKDISEPQGASTEQIGKQLDAMVADPKIETIILDVDSPGGTVSGVAELSDKIFAARDKKNIIAIANAQAASAAYWIASAANELVVTPSGEVGSIGVFLVHQDISENLAKKGIKTTLIKAGKFKAEGNPFSPLEEEALENFQNEINVHYEAFVKAVARNRGFKPNQIKSGFGQGRMVNADDAVFAGMADRVATMDELLLSFGVESSEMRRPFAEDTTVDPIAEEAQPEPEKLVDVDIDEMKRQLVM